MNIKLENLKTYKESLEEEIDTIKYAHSIIYSNKNSLEVSIIKELNLINQNSSISLFGIFDGHNGSEVSKYLSQHFIQFLTENINFINGNYKKSLEETFINLDESFRSLEAQLELSKYSNKKEQNKNKDNFKDFLELFNPRNLEGVNIAEFCGSCGIVELITEKKVFIANAGNSKCIPVNIKNEIIKDKINIEHTLDNENEIKRLSRIFGYEISDTSNNKDKLKNDFYLNITRGFGNLQYKDNKLINLEDQCISVKPDIIEISIEELNYLIIGNNECFGGNNDENLLSLEKYFLENFNKNNEKKINTVIEEFFDEKIKEIENIQEKDSDINNLASIIIEFKHENNINSINFEESKEEIKNKINNSNEKNKSEDEDENL
jgi:serine/threonine protein phosphatase PrpC